MIWLAFVMLVEMPALPGTAEQRDQLYQSEQRVEQWRRESEARWSREWAEMRAEQRHQAEMDELRWKPGQDGYEGDE